MSTVPYARFVSYGIGRAKRKSREFERRDKRSFRRWLRRRRKLEDHERGASDD